MLAADRDSGNRRLQMHSAIQSVDDCNRPARINGLGKLSRLRLGDACGLLSKVWLRAPCYDEFANRGLASSSRRLSTTSSAAASRRPVDRARHPDARHAGAVGRLDAVHRIFDDRTRRGRHAQPLAASWNTCGSGLPRDHIGAGHHRGELLTPAELFQTQRDILGRPRRTDRRSGNRRPPAHRSVPRPHPSPENWLVAHRERELLCAHRAREFARPVTRRQTCGGGCRGSCVQSRRQIRPP